MKNSPSSQDAVPIDEVAETPFRVVSAAPSLIHHGIWVFIGRLVNVSVASLSAFIVARVLGPEEFGRFSSVMSATQLLSLLGIFGLDQAVVREVGRRFAADDSASVPDVLGTLFRVFLCSVAATMGVSAIFFAVLGKSLLSEEMHVAAITGIMFFIAARIVIQTGGETCRALHDFSAANLLSGMSMGPMSTLLFFAALFVCRPFFALTWSVCIWIYALAGLFSIALLARRIRSSSNALSRGRETGSATPQTLDLLIHAALPMCLISIVTFASTRADVLLLSFCSRPDEVAIYEVARRLTLLLSIPLGLMNTTVVTSISRLYVRDHEQPLQGILQSASALAALPCLAAVILFMTAPAWVITTCFGAEYVSAAPILQILVPGQLVFTLTGSCGLVLVHTGHARIAIMTAAIAGLTVIATAPWAIARFGPAGLAAVMTLSISFENAANWWCAGKMIHIWTHPDLRHLLRFIHAKTSNAI